MQYHVFLSHAGEDKDGFVRHLHSALAEEGILCFFDADAKYSLPVGTEVCQVQMLPACLTRCLDSAATHTHTRYYSATDLQTSTTDHIGQVKGNK